MTPVNEYARCLALKEWEKKQKPGRWKFVCANRVSNCASDSSPFRALFRFPLLLLLCSPISVFYLFSWFSWYDWTNRRVGCCSTRKKSTDTLPYWSVQGCREEDKYCLLLYRFPIRLFLLFVLFPLHFSFRVSPLSCLLICLFRSVSSFISSLSSSSSFILPFLFYAVSEQRVIHEMMAFRFLSWFSFPNPYSSWDLFYPKAFHLLNGSEYHKESGPAAMMKN